MSHIKYFSIITMVVTVSLILAACAPKAAPQADLTPLTVQLQWIHQSQFAGLYAADTNGFYADEGLKVTFIEGGPTEHIQSVVDGTAQFGIANADQLILKRIENEPLTAIATVYRRSPVVFISLAEFGITSPEQIAGKTIRVTTNIVPTLHAMTTQVGIQPDQYTEVILPSDFDLFISGEVPVWSAYLGGFTAQIQEAGYEFNIIYPDDYGVHFYADTIYTTDSLIASDPDLVLRFLRASLKGWTYATENPGEVGELVAGYSSEADVELENKRMLAILPLINTGEDHIGWMKAEVWTGMAQTLEEQGVLTATMDVTEVYTTQFLEEIYGK
jgi:NitT/TauT family transport system substrate-binding protein